MKKKLFVTGVSILLMMLVFSGCQEKGTTVNKTSDKVFFESDILALVNGSLEIIRNKEDVITEARVTFYLKNLLEKPIYNLTLAADFCDNNGNVLYSHPYEYISGFPAEYREASPNRFSYNGENVTYVDHVNLRVVYYRIAE
jgi:hypothetical protein